MLSVRAAWWSMNSIPSPTAAPCRLEEALPTRLFCFAFCKPKDSWVLPSFPPNYSHLGSLNTRVFLTEPGTHNQMTRARHCFMLRWSLCSVFCWCNTQMSSAKVFKKPDLLRPNFNHQWAVCVIILSHQSMPVSSPSKLLQISVVKNINNLISPHSCSSSSSFRDWASLWNSREKFIHLFESKHLCTISLAQCTTLTLQLLHLPHYLAIWKQTWQTRAIQSVVAYPSPDSVCPSLYISTGK